MSMVTERNKKDSGDDFGGGSHFGTVTSPKKYDMKRKRIKPGMEARKPNADSSHAQEWDPREGH